LFVSDFLTPKTTAIYRDAMLKAVHAVTNALPDQPYSGTHPARLSGLLRLDLLPKRQSSLSDVLERLSAIVTNSVMVSHPGTAAHLHSPPLIAALAAEVAISALNQSMDSFDQAPAATVVEQQLVEWLCGRAGLPAEAAGIFSSGGTQSNFMGLLLARDSCLQTRWKWSAQKQGLPADAARLRILCSDAAHFTVEKSAAQLGLGTDAVIRVPTDDSSRISVESLSTNLRKLDKANLVPMAIVATAGTTDFGSIDPLKEIALLSRSSQTWFHVDAAYGGALLFSLRNRQLLNGIEMADSIGMDFHKLFWQPISCSAFLLRDGAQFRHMELHADYLNPEVHEELGIPDLVSKSLATTRRFDALKLWISLQVLGEEKLGMMIDRTLDLARHAAQVILRTPRLELFQEPSLGCVLFRYRPLLDDDSDRLNAGLRQGLLDRGIAVIGHTRIQGRQYLKLTCMNPAVSEEQYESLLTQVVQQGQALEGELHGS
jgi:L-2,4-diaminobutyrate decarboxylase